MGKIYNNIVETVGGTPLVRLNKVTEGVDATVLLKCEFFNPLSSVKDRIGMSMIEAAEADINDNGSMRDPVALDDARFSSGRDQDVGLFDVGV